jgi:hypothetical protein
MAKGSSQKKLYTNESGLNFEAQLWDAAEQVEPAPRYEMPEYNRVRPEGLCQKCISNAFEKKREQLLFGSSDPKSEWFMKDEPQSAESAEIRERWRIIPNIHESRTLAALRNALLWKLLSGELLVPAAAKLTEAAA